MQTPGIIACVILAVIIIGALVVSLKKSKTLSTNGGTDTEPGKGDLGTGNGKNK